MVWRVKEVGEKIEIVGGVEFGVESEKGLVKGFLEVWKGLEGGSLEE